MRVVFAGTPEVAVPSLRALLDSHHEVVAVVTRPDARAGRGRTLRPSPVSVAAQEAGVEVLTPPNARDPEFLARLAELAPDVVPVVAYGHLVPREALDVPHHGWINLHFSLLPRWRGAAPVQQALIAGDTRTGACAFVLEEGLDTGPIVDSLVVDVDPEESAGDLLDRLAVVGAPLLLRALDALEDGAATLTPQEGTPTHAPKLERADARIDWSLPATRIHDLVRGCTPAPGAWTTWHGAPVKVLETRVVPAEDASTEAFAATPPTDEAPTGPAQIRAGRTHVVVGTGEGLLELLRVQPQGKKPMAAADWARGARTDGETFDDE
ncbi:methionyl-tRNA formyltransferase [Mobilicoccus pelagius]|uniref:Methionyl-tRNA formyltransferase n=1 Tax=Mobilicoccus pelagius NBRC 104925 TaxID=1089455 RepID=H5UV01_9MICO|nr:methionyl-tRNA formyltransferase [Mobilicoccus pelagius]GAB49559.1 methionyl-tRNA formyltransferase [Mobilicoccus pelagius NBRC 104925]